MKDGNGRKIKVNDYIMYAYGFGRPIVGIVRAIYRNGIKIDYESVRMVISSKRNGLEQTSCMNTTVCKKIEYTVVVTDLIDNDKFREVFRVNQLLDLMEISC